MQIQAKSSGPRRPNSINLSGLLSRVYTPCCRPFQYAFLVYHVRMPVIGGCDCSPRPPGKRKHHRGGIRVDWTGSCSVTLLISYMRVRVVVVDGSVPSQTPGMLLTAARFITRPSAVTVFTLLNVGTDSVFF